MWMWLDHSEGVWILHPDHQGRPAPESPKKKKKKNKTKNKEKDARRGRVAFSKLSVHSPESGLPSISKHL
jgi:hypothetical protein